MMDDQEYIKITATFKNFHNDQPTKEVIWEVEGYGNAQAGEIAKSLCEAMSDFIEFASTGKANDKFLRLLFNLMKRGDTSRKLAEMAYEELVGKMALGGLLDEIGKAIGTAEEEEEEVEVPDVFKNFMDTLGDSEGSDE